MNTEENCNSSLWRRDEEKAFENALANYPEDFSDRWEKIGEAVPGKTIAEIKHHYDLLVEDVNAIELGLVPLPCYVSSEGSVDRNGEGGAGKKGEHSGKGSRLEQERRKGIAWTEDEHRLFLLGLDKYGKGDWRSISRNFVVSRTPTQVASHAQKYFIRLNSMNKDRRRSSIHDITSVGGNSGDVSLPQGPITGQINGPIGPTGKSSKQLSYGPTTIGQPVGRPLIPAVGTPVNLQKQAHLAYGMQASVNGNLVTGAPVNMAPMTYQMPHATAHR